MLDAITTDKTCRLWIEESRGHASAIQQEKDAGGNTGFREFLADIRNPDRPGHDYYLEWCGGDFDPNMLIWVADWSDTPTSHTRMVYDGWRVILELDALDDNRVKRKFTWGLDLSGSLERAGGIGGLQAIEDLDDPNDANDLHGQFVACYDGLGNLTQLIDWESAMTAGSFDASTHIAAHYEYSPYGQVVRQTGSYAAENPFRFSTKWFDGETGLGNWGRRYLIPEQGRWLNRDPIGENGGLNLFAYVINSPLVNYDPFGESSLDALSPMVSVCCQYEQTSYIDGSFYGIVYQADVICGIANPNECCRCAGISEYDDGINSLKLVKASYGKCCTCTIYKVRNADDAWPKHQSLIVECPNKAWKIDFQMKGGADTDYQISCPGTISVSKEYQPPKNNPGVWSIQDSRAITCESANKLLELAETMSSDPPDWGLITDCHWYTRKLFKYPPLYKHKGLHSCN